MAKRYLFEAVKERFSSKFHSNFLNFGLVPSSDARAVGKRKSVHNLESVQICVTSWKGQKKGKRRKEKQEKYVKAIRFAACTGSLLGAEGMMLAPRLLVKRK